MQSFPRRADAEMYYGEQGRARSILPYLIGKTARDFPDLRQSLHASQVAPVTLISRSQPNAPKRGYADECEIAIPYAGVFLWRVGSITAAVDANCTLFISEGQEFSEVHPVADRGHAAAVVTLRRDTLEELKAHADAGALGGFKTLVASASPRTQLLSSLLLHWSDCADPLRGDETVIELLREVLSSNPPRGRADLTVVTRAKALLQDWIGAEFSLADAANEIGVTPVYLTHAFKRVEGVPLYAYFQRLRFARALHLVPLKSSLTEVALELGFSSHSHFASAFHRYFNVTPSEYRDIARPTVHAAPPGNGQTQWEQQE